MPPATRPATAPARTRFVGAALRTAKMVTAKGTMAMIGIESRHSSHSLPRIMLFQCALGVLPRLIAPSSAITANGSTIVNGDIPCCAPGRASLVRYRTATPTTTSANATFNSRKITARVVVISARTPNPTNMRPSAITAPALTAMAIARPTKPRSTGSTFALSMATSSSVLNFRLPRDKGRKRAQAAVDVDLDTRFRDAAALRRLRYAPPFELHTLNRASNFFRQPSQEFPDVMGTLGACIVVVRQNLAFLVERHVCRHSGPAQIVDELVSGDGVHPGRQRLPGVVGVALEMNGQQHFLHQILGLRRAASEAGELALEIGSQPAAQPIEQ